MNTIKKISALSIIFSIIFFACKKNNTNNSYEENYYLKDAVSNMKMILSEEEFASLDWENGVIKKPGTSSKDIQVVIKSRNNINTTLIYQITGDMKMYKWNNEVHLADPKMKINKVKNSTD